MSSYSIALNKLLYPQEIKKILKVCELRSQEDLAQGRKTWVTRYMLVHLALATGLRVSELARIKLKNLNLNIEYPNLTVPNHTRPREVYLGNKIIHHINDYLNLKVKTWGQQLNLEDHLLQNARGARYTAGALEFSFKKAAEEANFDRVISIHCARHTYACALLAKTDNLNFVMRQLGHSNISYTALYRTLLPEVQITSVGNLLD